MTIDFRAMRAPTLLLVSTLLINNCASQLIEEYPVVGKYTGPVEDSTSETMRAKDPLEVMAAVEISNSEFESGTKYLGPFIEENNLIYRLRSWVTPTQGAIGQDRRINHQIYVAHINFIGDWVFWNRASSDAAQPMKLTVIDRDVVRCTTESCQLRETFGIGVEHSLLEGRRLAGLRVKIYSQRGYTAVLELPASMIEGQLRAIDANN